MKRLFWLILGAIAVWFFARRRMDSLYAEISRLREFERRELELDAELAEQETKWIKKDAAYLASLSPEEKIDYELKQARINSYLKDELGEDFFNEYKS